MTDVLSYRTDKIEELKKLAKEKNVSLSQLTSDIIEEYLEFELLTSKYKMHRDSEKLISYIFEFLDESTMEKIIDFCTNEVVISLKTMTNDFSIASILNIIKNWLKFNNLTLDEFDEDSHIKLVCNNNLSRNWNIMNATVFTKIFEHFGYSGMVDSTQNGFLSFKISKQKFP